MKKIERMSARVKGMNASIMAPLVDAFAESKARMSLLSISEDKASDRYDAYGNDTWSNVTDDRDRVTTLAEKMSFLASQYGNDPEFQALQDRYDRTVLGIKPSDSMAP